jgi:hypothetical protein
MVAAIALCKEPAAFSRKCVLRKPRDLRGIQKRLGAVCTSTKLFKSRDSERKRTECEGNGSGHRRNISSDELKQSTRLFRVAKSANDARFTCSTLRYPPWYRLYPFHGRSVTYSISTRSPDGRDTCSTVAHDTRRERARRRGARDPEGRGDGARMPRNARRAIRAREAAAQSPRARHRPRHRRRAAARRRTAPGSLRRTTAAVLAFETDALVNHVFQSTSLSIERRVRDKSVPSLIETIAARTPASWVRAGLHYTNTVIASIGPTRVRRWQMFCS